MYYSDRVTLVKKASERDEKGLPILDDIGNPLHKETRTEVWADVRSPGRAETAAAGAQGLIPTATVVVHVSDYKGETVVEVGGSPMSVYRTYRRGEDIELYVTEKRGDGRG